VPAAGWPASDDGQHQAQGARKALRGAVHTPAQALCNEPVTAGWKVAGKLCTSAYTSAAASALASTQGQELYVYRERML